MHSLAMLVTVADTLAVPVITCGECLCVFILLVFLVQILPLLDSTSLPRIKKLFSSAPSRLFATIVHVEEGQEAGSEITISSRSTMMQLYVVLDGCVGGMHHHTR
uniref:Secreted protein n=1 Tax=Leptocylindrus danicus TaxID=163516 RepID=A0A7S2KH68_9STRA|mmetsp:Transcript_22810/g.34235  ORF Transcript_22810/g.34235 Transcript_22810/m.34235 type:complete len:105 (+) Transcript_22810:63-377(+)